MFLLVTFVMIGFVALKLTGHIDLSWLWLLFVAFMPVIYILSLPLVLLLLVLAIPVGLLLLLGIALPFVLVVGVGILIGWGFYQAYKRIKFNGEKRKD